MIGIGTGGKTQHRIWKTDSFYFRWFGGSDATAVAGVYSTISSYKLYDPRFNVICDTDNAQPDCQAEGVYAFTDTNPGAGASPIIYLCGLWFSAPPNLGCVNPSSQGDDFNAQYQDTTFLHELTHLQTSIFGKPILDRPPATSDIPSDPDCFNVECVKGFVADAISSSPYAAAYRTQWVAQAYVFFGWSLYANSPSCAGS